MDLITSFVSKTKTLYKLDKPSITAWLVAHNGKDCAHVVELQTGCECLTGLGMLEKFASEKEAQTRAAEFGWKPPVELEAVDLKVI